MVAATWCSSGLCRSPGPRQCQARHGATQLHQRCSRLCNAPGLARSVPTCLGAGSPAPSRASPACQSPLPCAGAQRADRPAPFPDPSHGLPKTRPCRCFAGHNSGQRQSGEAARRMPSRWAQAWDGEGCLGQSRPPYLQATPNPRNLSHPLCKPLHNPGRGNAGELLALPMPLLNACQEKSPCPHPEPEQGPFRAGGFLSTTRASRLKEGKKTHGVLAGDRPFGRG